MVIWEPERFHGDHAELRKYGLHVTPRRFDSAEHTLHKRQGVRVAQRIDLHDTLDLVSISDLSLARFGNFQIRRANVDNQRHKPDSLVLRMDFLHVQVLCVADSLRSAINNGTHKSLRPFAATGQHARMGAKDGRLQ